MTEFCSSINFNIFVPLTAPTYAWNFYLNAYEAVLKGVLAGSNIYVGGGVDGTGQSVPALLDGGKCYSFLGPLLNNCVYLANQPGNFEWIKSDKGDSETGQVVYGGIPVGRVLDNGVWRIGKISNNLKSLLYAIGGKERTAKSFEALVFKPYSSSAKSKRR
jgi:hypothetical protein